jgi:cellulose synthase operon protein C
MLTLLSACRGDSEIELIASARNYIEKHNNKAAIIQLKAALQKNPLSGEARFLLGDVLLKNGDATAAVVELEKAQDLKYRSSEVLPSLTRALLTTGEGKRVTELYSHVNLPDPKAAASLKASVAEAFARQGLVERSEAAVNDSLQLNPKNAAARLMQARLQASRGAFDEAVKLVDALLVDEPQNSAAHLLRGELLWLAFGDLESGVRSMRAALALEPQHLQAHSSLIEALLQMRDVDGFRTQVDQLMKALPNQAEARFYLAQLAFLDMDYKRARNVIQQLLRVLPDNSHVQQFAGVIEFHSGSLRLAETHLVKSLELSPNLPLARRLLAETYLRLGQPAKTLSTLQPVLELARPSAETLSLAADAHFQVGESAKADGYLAEAAKLKPSDPKVRTSLALRQIATGDVEGGFEQLESLALSDQGTYADLALVNARMRRNDLEGALKAVDRLQTKLPSKAVSEHLRGRILAAGNDTDGARASFEVALSTDPVYFPAVAGLASLDLAENKPDAARKRFEELLAREPNDYRTRLALAELRQQAGVAPAEIGKMLDAAAKLNPTEIAPLLLLIDHHLNQRDTKAALSAARDATAALPEDMQALDALGRVQLAAGDTQQAITSFGKVAAQQPESSLAQLRLAEAHVQDKNIAAATLCLRKALELSPNLLEAQRGLIRVALADKRVDEALAVARSIQKQRPTEAVGYLLEGEIQGAQKHWDAAIAVYRSALQRSRTSDVAIGLHRTFLLAGLRADADRFAAAWRHEQPHDAAFAFHLGSVALDQRDYVHAEAQYRNVLAIRERDALALNNVAWLLVQQGKSGALVLAEQANQAMPNHPALMDTLAAALAAENQLPKAIEWQRRALNRDSYNPTYRFGLAKLLLKSGDRINAKTELETLARLGDTFAGQAEVTALLKAL